jgi:hypothetical protein
MFHHPVAVNRRYRLPDWEAGYQSVLDAWSLAYTTRTKRHWLDYGYHDCATFCADMVNAVWGLDPMMGMRGAYISRKGALAWLGAGSLSEVIAHYMAPLAPHLAKRGDVVVYTNSLNHRSHKQGLAIKDHIHLLAPSSNGLALLQPPILVGAFTLDRET